MIIEVCSLKVTKPEIFRAPILNYLLFIVKYAFLLFSGEKFLAEKVTDKQYVGLAFKKHFTRTSVGLSTLEFGTRRLEEGTR